MEDINTPSNEAEEERKKKALTQRLADAKAAQQRIRDQREALETATELERRVTREEQSAQDQEALLGLEAEHGRDKIGTVETDMGVIVLKRPGSLRYKKFQDLENAKTFDVEKLVRPCVIHPDKNRFDLICEELPATLLRCGNRVAELAGTRHRELSGK